MQASLEASYVRPQLSLSLNHYKVDGGSIVCGREGTTFGFTLGPLSDAAVTAFEDAARKNGRICLLGCGDPLLFDLVALERKDLGKVRIVGRIVGVAFDQNGGSLDNYPIG